MYLLNKITSLTAYLINAHAPAGVHSPFLFQLLPFMFDPERQYYAFRHVDQALKRVIALRESGIPTQALTAMHEIYLRRHASAFKYQCLFRLGLFCHARKILEVGSANGISTTYLSHVHPTAQLIVLEERAARCQVIRQITTVLATQAIEVQHGSLKQILKTALRNAAGYDLAILNGALPDAIEYFTLLQESHREESIVVVEGIRSSAEAWKNWQAVRQEKAVTAALDVFAFGIILFRSAFRDLVDLQIIPRRWPPKLILR